MADEILIQMFRDTLKMYEKMVKDTKDAIKLMEADNENN